MNGIHYTCIETHTIMSTITIRIKEVLASLRSIARKGALWHVFKNGCLAPNNYHHPSNTLLPTSGTDGQRKRRHFSFPGKAIQLGKM